MRRQQNGPSNDYGMAPDVFDFLKREAARVGAAASDAFCREVGVEVLEKGITSPIEQMFYAAMRSLCDIHEIPVNPYPEFGPTGGVYFPRALWLREQVTVERFRVDFMVVFGDEGDAGPRVAVELDGHEFHDKDKKQRSYEKARDRFLMKAGYTVFHYTGSDVVSDPVRVATEVLLFCGALERGDGSANA
jgi:very-short-patch-repair endonuclease